MKNTDWIVVKFGQDVPPNVWRMACLRCGDTNDIQLPMGVTALLKASKPFTNRHKGCE